MVVLRKRHLISEIKCCLRYNKLSCDLCCCSVPKSCLTLCNPMDLMQVQHAKLPCPSPSPVVCPSSCPMNQWCHPTISSSVVPFSSCPQSLPASESFPMSQLFTWGGQSIGVSALPSFLPTNTQGWSPLEWTGWISLLSKGLLCTIMLRKKHNRDFWWCVANRGDKCMKLASSFKMTTHSGWLEQYWSIPFVSV